VLADVRIPVLVLAGERDAKFIELGQLMAGEISNATFAVIPGAGHAAHAEQPAATAALVSDWLTT
jgi:2-succinyl-6-hydroxy-2,4-cyclohexadiene-1-carboxylate synthase